MKPGVDYIGVTTPFYCHDGKGNFLFHKRSKNCRDEQGMWDLGGGKLEMGLTLEENVIKEVMEEYGVMGKVQEHLPAQTCLRMQNGQMTHWIAIPSFVLVDPKKVKINDPEKIDEIGWFKLTKLPKPLHSQFLPYFKENKKYFIKYMK